MNPLIILLFASLALAADFSGGAPSSSYGAPSVGGPNGIGGYSYDGDLQGAASTLDGALQDPIEALAASIPGGGVPGEDYPILSSVPDTGFTCEDQEFPGYFADTADEAGCQVFHICQFDGRLDSFLCPNGTIFNQQYFVCDWWNNVDCSMSEQFRSLNAEIGKIMEDTAASFRSDVVDPSQLYGLPQQRQSQTPAQTYSAPQQRQQTPTQSYSAPQQRQSQPSAQTYSVPQQRQQTPAQTYSAPEERQPVPAPSQSYNGAQERQVPTPAPIQSYSAPQDRQSVPTPSQSYSTPQDRQSVPTPSQSYGTPQDRQATVPPPSQFYNSPSRF